jgi:hypothetical protein
VYVDASVSPIGDIAFGHIDNETRPGPNDRDLLFQSVDVKRGQSLPFLIMSGRQWVGLTSWKRSGYRMSPVQRDRRITHHPLIPTKMHFTVIMRPTKVSSTYVAETVFASSCCNAISELTRGIVIEHVGNRNRNDWSRMLT